MRSFSAITIAVSLIFLAGCNSFHRSHDIDEVGAVAQPNVRFVFATDKGGYEQDRRVVCAEPSPDALSAASFALSASGGTPTAGGGLGFGSSQAAASIGLRTQTIQLLRDGYYRLCEAFMNGTISRQQYTLALVNIDRVMVPLMAIDAVAGTPRPPAVTITPGNPSVDSSAAVTGEGGEGADPASSNNSANVGAAAAALQIGGVNPPRPGLNEHETAVLEKALSMVEEHAVGSMCMAYLADPYFIEAVDVNTYQDVLAEKCTQLMELKIQAEIQRNSQ